MKILVVLSALVTLSCVAVEASHDEATMPTELAPQDPMKAWIQLKRSPNLIVEGYLPGCVVADERGVVIEGQNISSPDGSMHRRVCPVTWAWVRKGIRRGREGDIRKDGIIVGWWHVDGLTCHNAVEAADTVLGLRFI